MAYGSSARNGLDREAWLEAALLMLQTRGVEGVRVEPLAKQLGVTKGSFYWHFTNREALLVEVLNHWAHQLTTALRDEVAGLGCGPAARLWRLRQKISESEATAYELAMRSWAAFDRLAADTVEKVDRERMAFVQSQFAQLGFIAEEAEARTRLYVYYQTVEPSIHDRGAPESRERIAILQHELLTGQPASRFLSNGQKKVPKKRALARRRSRDH